MTNVVTDYDWTSSPKGSGIRNNAPKVWITSYKLRSSQIMQSIKGFITIGQGLNKDATAFYEDLYGKSSTKDEDFIFPYFGDDIRGFSQTFGDTFQSGVGENGNAVGGALYDSVKGLMGGLGELYNLSDNATAAKAVKQLTTGDIMGAGQTMGDSGSPGTYIETPMFYQFAKNDRPLQVSFVLSNTINQGSFQDNHDLVVKLTKINRPLRINSIAVEPPRIYKVIVPGQRYIRWAWCSDFGVSLLGTRREINGVLTPEGYKIDMSFQSLTMEHAGFMDQINQTS